MSASVEHSDEEGLVRSPDIIEHPRFVNLMPQT